MNVSIRIAVARYFYLIKVSKVLLFGNMDTFEYYKNVNHISVLTLECGHFLQIMTKICLEFNQGVHSSLIWAFENTV